MRRTAQHAPAKRTLYPPCRAARLGVERQQCTAAGVSLAVGRHRTMVNHLFVKLRNKTEEDQQKDDTSYVGRYPRLSRRSLSNACFHVQLLWRGAVLWLRWWTRLQAEVSLSSEGGDQSRRMEPLYQLTSGRRFRTTLVSTGGIREPTRQRLLERQGLEPVCRQLQPAARPAPLRGPWLS